MTETTASRPDNLRCWKCLQEERDATIRGTIRNATCSKCGEVCKVWVIQLPPPGER